MKFRNDISALIPVFETVKNITNITECQDIAISMGVIEAYSAMINSLITANSDGNQQVLLNNV